MIQERYEQMDDLLRQYLNENNQMGLMGECKDPSSKEYNGLVCPGLDRESETVKKLESLGFKVIYPAPLREEIVDRMDEAKRYSYMARMNNALVIDGKENCLSLNLEDLIAKHYFAAGITPLAGMDFQNNSVTRYGNNYDFPPETNANYKALLDDIGFQTEMDDKGNVTTSSNIPYPVVRRSKFERIYDKAKEKIQGAIAKLKALVNPKNKVQENDNNERE